MSERKPEIDDPDINAPRTIRGKYGQNRPTQMVDGNPQLDPTKPPDIEGLLKEIEQSKHQPSVGRRKSRIFHS